MTRVIILKSRLAIFGGLERYALHLAQTFHEKGCQVTLLTTGSITSLQENYSILSLHSPSIWGVLSILKFHLASKKWLKRHPYDLIFSLDRTPFTTHYRAGNGTHLSYLKAKKGLGFSLFLSKCNPKNSLILFLEKKLFQNKDLKTLYTNSNMVKEQLLKQYKIPSNAIKVIHNGVDFTTLPLPSSIFSSKEPQLLFVGHDYKRKGLELLLKALGSLNHLPFHLVVIGKDKQASKYKKLAKTLGLNKKISFKGRQRELLEDYQNADCLILPTMYDPFANVTLEALAMGLYVITSSSNGAKEVVKEGCGYILDSLESPDELKCCLENFLEKKATVLSKDQIRSSIKHLTLRSQIFQMVNHALDQVEN